MNARARLHARALAVPHALACFMSALGGPGEQPLHDTDALCDYLNDLLSNMEIDGISFNRLNEAIAVSDILEQAMRD